MRYRDMLVSSAVTKLLVKIARNEGSDVPDSSPSALRMLGSGLAGLGAGAAAGAGGYFGLARGPHLAEAWRQRELNRVIPGVQSQVQAESNAIEQALRGILGTTKRTGRQLLRVSKALKQMKVDPEFMKGVPKDILIEARRTRSIEPITRFLSNLDVHRLAAENARLQEIDFALRGRLPYRLGYMANRYRTPGALMLGIPAALATAYATWPRGARGARGEQTA